MVKTMRVRCGNFENDINDFRKWKVWLRKEHTCRFSGSSLVPGPSKRGNKKAKLFLDRGPGETKFEIVGYRGNALRVLVSSFGRDRSPVYSGRFTVSSYLKFLGCPTRCNPILKFPHTNFQLLQAGVRVNTYKVLSLQLWSWRYISFSKSAHNLMPSGCVFPRCLLKWGRWHRHRRNIMNWGNVVTTVPVNPQKTAIWEVVQGSLVIKTNKAPASERCFDRRGEFSQSR